MTAVVAHDLMYPCGTVIPQGEPVEIVECFAVNRERKSMLRIRWNGRLWPCNLGDVKRD